jgi:uncharacterized protein (DUF1697 family)
MYRYIAILRGINVGGNRKILMSDLKDLFIQQGFKNVKTYIQSGNVIFDSDDESSVQNLSEKIQNAILHKFNFEVPVIIKCAHDFARAIQLNPFVSEEGFDIDRLHLTFLSAVSSVEDMALIKSFDVGNDRFEIVNDQIFIYCFGKYSDSKLTNSFFESKLKVKASTRNWNTVLKLNALCKD